MRERIWTPPPDGVHYVMRTYPDGRGICLSILPDPNWSPPCRGKRGKIKGFSGRSWAKMADAFNRLPDNFRTMTTLTFHNKWPATAADCYQSLRRYLRQGSKFPSHFWALEFQKRGAPHYHVVTAEPVDEREALLRWQWATGDPTITQVNVVHLENHAAAYFAKDANKRYQKSAPPGFCVGRFWGHSRGLLLPPNDQIVALPEAPPYRFFWGPDAEKINWPLACDDHGFRQN